MKKRDLIFISLWFYIGWFGSVFLARVGLSATSLLFPVALIFFMTSRKILNLKESILALAIALGGVLFDASLIYFGFIKTLDESFLLTPYWLISLWLLFSLSILKLGRELKISLWLAALLGLFGGPLSYQSGEFFKVLTFTNPSTTLIYALFWSILFPLVFILSRRFV